MPVPLPVKGAAAEAAAGRATGRARNALLAIAAASIALLWLSPFALFSAAYLIPAPSPGEHGLAYARVYTVQFTPAVALISVALCGHAFLNYKPSRLFAIATFWTAVSGWWLCLFASPP